VRNRNEAVSLADLKKRDPKAITAVVNRHTGDLLRGAFGLGWRQAEAEELVQETFVTFLDVVERFKGHSTIRTFLFGILYNKSKERGRKRSRELATDPVDAVFENRFNFIGHWKAGNPQGPEDAAMTGETAEVIAECMEGLGETQRAAFHLKEVEHEDAASVCNILDVSGTHLRVLLFRARNKLRDCIEKKWGDRK